jgi:hypothetical protein
LAPFFAALFFPPGNDTAALLSAFATYAAGFLVRPFGAVVFGRVGESLTSRNVAGLHPKGDSSLTYIIGHLLPVDSETGASDGDLDEQYTTARFRVWLSPSKYHAVVRHIRELQASTPAWHVATFNCNAFVGIIAHFVGLTSPPTWLFPDDFVNSMRRMNEGHPRYASAPSARDAMARQVVKRR